MNSRSKSVVIAFSSSGSPYIEKTPTRDSHIEVVFGLNIVVRALRDTRARVAGQKLSKGTEVEVSLHDKIIFANSTEVSMAELRDSEAMRPLRVLDRLEQIAGRNASALAQADRDNAAAALEQAEAAVSLGTGLSVNLRHGEVATLEHQRDRGFDLGCILLHFRDDGVADVVQNGWVRKQHISVLEGEEEENSAKE